MGFVKTPLMDKGEYGAFVILERSTAQFTRGYHVMAQVSLGKFLQADPQSTPTPTDNAFAAINSKRVEFRVIDKAEQDAQRAGSGTPRSLPWLINPW